jgi:nitrate/nitrite transporter NarK
MMPHRALLLCALIVAGEAVFFLPFVLARVFRPTLLDVFGITNLELGIAFSIYGIIAMPAYFAGGPLADRFNPRLLLTIALVTTAAGGIVLMAIPALPTLNLLYAYWGITTIALFWAPLIRATRVWGHESHQGSAFGLLDGGRGLLAAVTGSVMVAVYAALLPDDVDAASLEQRAQAFRRVIQFMIMTVCAAALFLWLVMPARDQSGPMDKEALTLRHILAVLRMPSVWLQAFIILCAYVGFKSTDDFSLYAREVIGLNEVDAARAGTVSLWVRPVAAISAGYLADRIGSGNMTIGSFALLLLGSLVLASGAINAGMIAFFLLSIVCASLGIFALRGLYYAIMKEGRVPLAFTGSAVGFVSVIGYMPDVFMGPLMGLLLDRSPGPSGHQQVFWVVAGFALLGLIFSWAFKRITENGEK